MNDIARENIKKRLLDAIENEHLPLQDVAAIFGIHPSYISWIKNPNYWHKLGDSLWEKVLCWINSGVSLTKYKEIQLSKKGKTVPEITKTDTEIKDTDPKLGLNDIKSDPLLIKEAKKIKQAESVKKEEHKRLTNGQLIDLLLERKAELKAEVDAIDTLLKHYIS